MYWQFTAVTMAAPKFAVHNWRAMNCEQIKQSWNRQSFVAGIYGGVHEDLRSPSSNDPLLSIYSS